MVLLTSTLWLQSASPAISAEVDRADGLGVSWFRPCFDSWWPKESAPLSLGSPLVAFGSDRQGALFRTGKLLDLKFSGSRFFWTAPIVVVASNCSGAWGCSPLPWSMALRIQIRSLSALRNSGTFSPTGPYGPKPGPCSRAHQELAVGTQSRAAEHPHLAGRRPGHPD